MNIRSNLPRAHSYKWKTHASEILPLWVADMDYAPPEFLIRELHSVVDEADFGYTLAPENFRKAVREWIRRRHGFEIAESSVLPISGVVAGIASALQCFGKAGGSYVTLTPVYPLFLSAGNSAGMECLHAPLLSKNGRYEIDFDLLEKTIRPDTKAFLISHPHNPSGRNFTRAELQELLTICVRHNLVVISDEIWSDWVLNETPFVPFLSLGAEAEKRTIVFSSAGKTFNVPGLTAGYALVADPELRTKFAAHIRYLLPGANDMGLRALVSLFEHGEPWLAEAKKMVRQRLAFARSEIASTFPDFETTDPEASYLLWINPKNRFGADPFTRIFQEGKLALSDGKLFGKGGDGFIRMNVATSEENLKEALARLKKSVKGSSGNP